MTMSATDRSVSRRTAIAGLGAAGVVAGLAGMTNRTSAQADSLADHPLCGTWMVMSNPILGGTPQVQNVAVFSEDGTCLLVLPSTDVGPDGVVLQSPSAGIWEAYDERRGHFIATQILSDLEGMALGSLTVDGFPLVDEDGASFEDDNEMVKVTIRDASGAVIDSFPGAGARPVRGYRLTFDTVVFPESESGAATPPS